MWDLIVLIPDRCVSVYFATILFHLLLFSAALMKLVRSIPVHSLILAFHRFYYLPLLFPLTMPCRIVFAKPEDLKTSLKHLSFRFLDQYPEFIIFFNGSVDLSANHLIGYIHGGESRDLNDRVHGISCRYSDKTSKQTYHTFLKGESAVGPTHISDSLLRRCLSAVSVRSLQ